MNNWAKKKKHFENNVIIKISEQSNMINYRLLGDKDDVRNEVRRIIKQYPPFGYGTMEHHERRKQLNEDLFSTEISRYKSAD